MHRFHYAGMLKDMIAVQKSIVVTSTVRPDMSCSSMQYFGTTIILTTPGMGSGERVVPPPQKFDIKMMSFVHSGRNRLLFI